MTQCNGYLNAPTEIAQKLRKVNQTFLTGKEFVH